MHRAFPNGRPQCPSDNLQQRAFAGSVSPDDAKRFTFGNAKRDLAQCDHTVEGGPVLGRLRAPAQTTCEQGTERRVTLVYLSQPLNANGAQWRGDLTRR